jgi:molybdopterin molybdotransferase
MITIAQAIKIVEQNSIPTKSFECIPISKANGAVLFKDVISSIDMPPFRQSAMDGYAISIHGSTSYKIIDEVKAGDGHQPKLKQGEAIRIFTGAPVPNTSNAVIMQEKVEVAGETATILSTIAANENIRPKGEQISKGEIALTKGTLLTPGAIGFLASLGVSEVNVFKKPSIAIVVTGNELVKPGEKLSYGQIYESNGIMLTAALNNLGYHNVTNLKVGDDYNQTTAVLEKAISNYDMTIISGGISVGDYDFVGSALKELDVTQLFYKVKQKPGKPLFFGKRDDKMIFALPGNPAAALSCFYIYIYSALQRISGNTTFSIARTNAICESDFTKKGDRPQFLKAIYHDGKVKILEGQSSAMLHTFALSNALLYVPETMNSIKKNDEVDVILLPIN